MAADRKANKPPEALATNLPVVRPCPTRQGKPQRKSNRPGHPLPRHSPAMGQRLGKLTDQNVKSVSHQRRVNQNAAELHDVPVINVVGPLHPQVDVLEGSLRVSEAGTDSASGGLTEREAQDALEGGAGGSSPSFSLGTRSVRAPLGATERELRIDLA